MSVLLMILMGFLVYALILYDVMLLCRCVVVYVCTNKLTLVLYFMCMPVVMFCFLLVSEEVHVGLNAASPS